MNKSSWIGTCFPPSPSFVHCAASLEAITEPKLPEMHHRALLGPSIKRGYHQKLSINRTIRTLGNERKELPYLFCAMYTNSSHDSSQTASASPPAPQPQLVSSSASDNRLHPIHLSHVTPPANQPKNCLIHPISSAGIIKIRSST